MDEITNTLKKVTQGDIPAIATLAFMEEQRKFNQSIQISMNDLKNDIHNVCVSIEASNAQNKLEHEELKSGIAQLKNWMIAVLVVFAMASLYFLFRSAGLPTP